MKILLVAYTLSPTRGSEAATAWGWVSGLAQGHDVTSVTHGRYREEVEPWLAGHPELRLRMRWTDAESNLETEAQSYSGPLRGLVREVQWLRGYGRWLRMAVAACRELAGRERYDVVHFVSYGSISAPIRLWGLPQNHAAGGWLETGGEKAQRIPFVLGPAGGAQRIDPAYASILGALPWSQRFRNLRIRMLPWRPGIRAMARGAAVILSTNRETEQAVRRCGGRSLLFADTGIAPELLLAAPRAARQGTGLRMLWVGRMIYRKAVPIALRALQAVDRKDFTLDLVGSGPMEAEWKRLAGELGLADQVRFHGQVSFQEVTEYYDRSDVLVFCSVNDSFGSQLLEACARSLPVLTMNHQGAGTLLPDGAAWKATVTSPERTVAEMAEAMLRLEDAELRSSMGRAALEYARTEAWPVRIERMSELYRQVAAGVPVGNGPELSARVANPGEAGRRPPGAAR